MCGKLALHFQSCSHQKSLSASVRTLIKNAALPALLACSLPFSASCLWNTHHCPTPKCFIYLLFVSFLSSTTRSWLHEGRGVDFLFMTIFPVPGTAPHLWRMRPNIFSFCFQSSGFCYHALCSNSLQRISGYWPFSYWFEGFLTEQEY